MEHKLEIKLEDYITLDEMKDIVREEFATSVAKTLNANKDAIKKRIEDTINNFDIEELCKDYLDKKMEEVANEFGKISDFLYAISSK